THDVILGMKRPRKDPFYREPWGLYVTWGLLLAMDFYAYRRRPRRRLMSVAAILAIGGVTVAIGVPMQSGVKWIPLLRCLLASFVICLLAFGLSFLKWKWGERRQKIVVGESPVAPVPPVTLDALQPPARHWLLRIGWGQVALFCA